MAYDADLIVVGAGPGGYVAAIRAAQLGMKTMLVERDKLGGVCLNIGCIPSKALIHQAEIFRQIPDLQAMGIAVDASGLDYEKVYKKSRQAADKLSRGVQFLLDKNRVQIVKGEARLTGPQEVTLQDNRVFRGRHVLLATGSRPRALPEFPFDEERVLSSTGALMLQQLPKRLLIIGSGAIGVEFAHIMNAFGVEVTLVEVLDRILPVEDREVVEVLVAAFKKRGIRMLVSTKVVERQDDGTVFGITLEDAKGVRTRLEVDKVLVSVGRLPNTGGMGLEAAGIALDPGGFVTIGDWYQTSVPGVYAIGDIIRTPLLAHVASKEGEIAVEHMAGHNPVPRLPQNRIPGATYCEPQVASFGPTENKLKESGVPYAKATFPYRGTGKAVAIGQPEGLVKVLHDPDTKEILACHICGANATELIHEVLLAAQAELLPEDIAMMVHAHPTLSEAVMEAMRAAEGLAIHAP